MPLNVAVAEPVKEVETAVVAIGLPDDVTLRAVDGVVGYCRSGLFADRYILLVVPDDNGTWWGVEFSHPLRGEFEMEFTADFAEPWVDFKALLTTWDVDWCPPEVNDRALFLIFDPHVKDLPQSLHDRRLRALGAAPRVDLFTKPGAPIPIAVSPTYASALLRGALASAPTSQPSKGRRNRPERGDRIPRALERAIHALIVQLLPLGFGLALVPLSRQATLSPVTDPWGAFRVSSSDI